MDEDVEHRKWIRPGIRGCGGDEDGVDRRRCEAVDVDSVDGRGSDQK